MSDQQPEQFHLDKIKSAHDYVMNLLETYDAMARAAGWEPDGGISHFGWFADKIKTANLVERAADNRGMTPAEYAEWVDDVAEFAFTFLEIAERYGFVSKPTIPIETERLAEWAMNELDTLENYRKDRAKKQIKSAETNQSQFSEWAKINQIAARYGWNELGKRTLPGFIDRRLGELAWIRRWAVDHGWKENDDGLGDWTLSDWLLLTTIDGKTKTAARKSARLVADAIALYEAITGNPYDRKGE